MHRRWFLGLTACTVGLAGCSSDEDSSDEDSHVVSEGSPFITFDLVDNFSGTVRVVPFCRDDAVEIRITDGQPNASIPYTRNEPGEECTLEIFVDDEQAESVNISRSQVGRIDINEDGEVTVGIDSV